MARQLNGSVWQHLHTLVAAERLEIAQIKLKATIFRRYDLADLFAISVFAVRSKSHHFAFIAVFAIADEFANHGIETAQRVRKEYAVEHFNLVALTAGHHRGNKIARTVIAESSRLFPRRTVVRAGDVGDVVFEMVLLKTELRGIDIKRLGQQRTHVAHRLFALAKTNEVQNLGRIGEGVLNFLRKVRVAVLANGYVFHIRNLRRRLHPGKP